MAKTEELGIRVAPGESSTPYEASGILGWFPKKFNTCKDRERATRFSWRGDSKAANTEAQILYRIIYRQDCDLKMVQQDLT
ncbi:hypothetical protein evm_004985 [Chilo suppressalis]|nr:hypothetical protein evm_004985 [Chilo suppressalis]